MLKKVLWQSPPPPRNHPIPQYGGKTYKEGLKHALYGMFNNCGWSQTKKNSIAFGSAPLREADSQPISQVVRPAVSQTVIRASRQADRNTQFGFFFSVADSAPSSGEDSCWQDKQRSSGNTADRRLLGRRFESRLADLGGGGVNDDSRPARIRTADLQVCSLLHYHSTALCSDRDASAHCLNPSEHKLLTPPPSPLKNDIQFQGIEASESKNPLGNGLIGQNNDFTRGWTSNIMPWGMLRE